MNTIIPGDWYWTFIPDPDGKIRGLGFALAREDNYFPTHNSSTLDTHPHWPKPTYIDPADHDTVYYGLYWGIGWDTSLSEYPGRHEGVQQQTLPGLIKWLPGVEAQAAKYIQEVVTEGLLETVYASVHHWRFQETLYSRAGEVPGLNEQAAADYTAKKTVSLQHLRAASKVALDLEAEIKVKFKAAGSDIQKTLAVCSLYLAGKLGKDWHIRDYFKDITQPHKESLQADRYDRQGNRISGYVSVDMLNIHDKAREHLDEQAKIMDRHIKGNPKHHFSIDALKPFMKRFPTFARTYNIGE